MPGQDQWLAWDEPAVALDDFVGRELSFAGPQCAQGGARNVGLTCGNCTRTSLGLYLMFGLEHECAWPVWLLGVLYLLLLCWAFMGVAIVSNIFMEAIERITAKKLTRPKKGGAKGEVDTVLVWNPTVANLTLMALGSSAPEIILAILEIVLNGFQAGELGPGTIVGSAAFNMLIITAVCIIAIPSPQTRKIEQFGVYVFTAVISIWAYVWLIIILQLHTPNVVDIWEAVVTLVSFPLLVYIAYAIDTKKFDGCCRGARVSVATAQTRLSRYGSAKIVMEKIGVKRGRVQPEYIQPREAVSLLRVLRPDTSRLSEREIVEIGKSLKPKTRADHRNEALGLFPHHRKQSVDTPMDEKVKSMRAAMSEMNMWEVEQDTRRSAHFSQPAVSVLESAGKVEITVQARPAPAKTGTLVLAYTTRNGSGPKGSSATADEDYVPIRGLLYFGPSETKANLEIKLIDDDTSEPDEAFEVAFSLKPIEPDILNAKDQQVALAKMPDEAFDWEHKCAVMILDDDLPGVLSWSKRSYYVTDGEASIALTINRRRGAVSEVSTFVRTVETDSAVAGEDFIPIDEKFVLKEGQGHANVHIQLPMSRQARECKFEVEMYAPTGGVIYSKNGERCSVTLGETEEQSAYMNKAADLLNSALDGGGDPETRYFEQIGNAFRVMGGDDEAGPPTWQDWAYHLITVFWKVVYAIIPPPHWADGYPCFFCSLIMIGLTTWVVSDVATIWSCVVGLPKSCAAITVVAIGTSLPDTFASKSAAQNDPSADASITNVTGSNSVNVFLGLGLPWTMAAIYWASIGCEFRVEAQTLWFMVLIFAVNAIVCVLLLYVRRRFLGGELGGPAISKYLSAGLLTVMWVEYIVVGCIMA